MKQLFLFALLQLGVATFAWSASEANPSLEPLTPSLAVKADHRCAIEQVYLHSEGTPRGSAIRDAVDHCVSFERGAGAWYVKNRKGASSNTSSEVLQRIKAMAMTYVQQALPRCQQAQADVKTCLELLKL